MMLATGLRRGEALGLHWSDVDLDAGLSRVRWTLARTPRDCSSTSQRPTDPGGPCHSHVRRSRRSERVDSSRMTNDARPPEHGRSTAWSPPTEIGTPLEPRNVLRRFEVLADRAGLTGVTLHTLRHSAASFLLAAGTHTEVVQEHLGHSSSAITADIHSHVGPAHQREAAGRLDQALRW
ncbi:site-specific integrase [Geodermatophilus sabuli]|uniref:Site-specific integrase n=2 Tax=Geodermatophilus sabuli TaxID=1564158 RepID=A0A7K3VVU1_9ACTN|nr:site-specific integrase [Geodermatophilus sabuli]